MFARNIILIPCGAMHGIAVQSPARRGKRFAAGMDWCQQRTCFDKRIATLVKQIETPGELWRDFGNEALDDLVESEVGGVDLDGVIYDFAVHVRRYLVEH